uniref:F-box domain-containing protein n=1 Tax=Caenorhabditis tropicalis TaxID=1561998 RepID=A0A1I7T8K1_9PELO
MNDSQLISDRIFNNPVIVSEILNNLSNDLIDDLDCRLINKTFNSSCLSIIRKNHERIKIEYIGDQFIVYFGKLLEEDRRIFINYRSVRIGKVDDYFKFLRSAVNVKIRKVEIKNTYRMSENVQKMIHDSFYSTLIDSDDCNINVLTGGDNEFHMCSDCLKMFMKCSVFGPIGIQYGWKKTNKCLHYSTLVVTDGVLDFFARDMIQFENDYFDKCTNDITCDKLILQIHEEEYRWSEEDEERIYNDHPLLRLDGGETRRMISMCIPREVLESLIRKWKVKRIEIKFMEGQTKSCTKNKWTSTGKFSRIRFDNPYEKTEKSRMKYTFESVKIDLSDSLFWKIGFDEEKENGYKNLIANVRRMFPTENISIEFSHWRNRWNQSFEKMRENIMGIVFEEEQRNLRVDIQCFPFSTLSPEYSSQFHFRCHQFETSIQDSHEIIHRRRLENNQFIKEKWIGKRYKMVDEGNRCTINFDIYST